MRVDQRLATKAVDHVIVHHARRLHMRIADGRADELKPTLFQILAHGIRLGAGGHKVFQLSQKVHDRAAADKAPDISVKTAELFLHVEKFSSVVYCLQDLCAVANDPLVLEPSPDLSRAVA